MKKLSILFITFCIGLSHIIAGEGNKPAESIDRVVLCGYLKDSQSGETIVGGTVFVKETKTGTISNITGYYALHLRPGHYTIEFSYMGYEKVSKQVDLKSSTSINIELKPSSITLNEVIITDHKKNENITETQMSTIHINAETIKRMPALMGEPDVLKSIQLMPGVQSASEGSSGYNVRGGSSDQNLILYDEAPVYNPSHFMGFFSVFNSDALQDARMYKGDLPAEFGGRLASLLDIKSREGDKNKFRANGGIGTISSRLTVEGPIIKDRGSFFLSGRRTYADAFLVFSKDSNLKQNKLYFYDLNFKSTIKLGLYDKISFTAYTGHDVFGYKDLYAIGYGNASASAQWNHLYTDDLTGNWVLYFSDYTYTMTNHSTNYDLDWRSGVRDYGIKSNFTYLGIDRMRIEWGASVAYHRFTPGTFTNKITNETKSVPQNFALEYGLYISNKHVITDRLSAVYGLRYSLFQNIGPGKVYTFDQNHNPTGSTEYQNGDIFNTYGGLEPRVNATYILSPSLSIKSSYSRTRQYMQLASNNNTGFPLDVWFPASQNVKPQIADQVALGIFKNLKDDMFQLSVESFYKKMQNQIDFKDWANTMFNEKLEGELRFGKARCYGAELMVQKTTGKFTGWVSYTYCRARRQIEDINNNKEYAAPYEKPHNVSIVVNYEITKRISVGANWVYSTGAPVSLPTGQWEFGNFQLPVYSERNGYRLPDYHRLDLSVTFKNKEKPNRKFFSEWNLSVFNVYNRKNAYTIFFNKDYASQSMKAYKLSFFGIVPAITYNFRF